MQFEINVYLSQLIIYISHQYIAVDALIGDNVRAANDEEFSFVVAIMRVVNENKDRQIHQSCTGSLISRRDVLTSAHCLDIEKLHPIQVIAGSRDIRNGKKYSTAWWITYNEWALYKNIVPEYEENDIGIIRLSQNVSDEITHRDVSAMSYFNMHKLRVRIAGWGIGNDGLHPEILQTLDLNIIYSKTFERKMTQYFKRSVVSDERFLHSAAKPYGLINFGDSGGPLMYNNMLIAINRGTCPHDAPESEKINLHIVIYLYYDFIEDVKYNFR